MVFQDLNCTRLGRYAGGEIRDTTSSHPIIQFLINPYYEGRLNLEFEHKDDCYCAKIPKKAKPKPSRISEICGNNIRVLDVGCSSGANLLLLEDLLSRAADKKVEVKGYDNDEKIIANAKRRRVCYHTRQALLHPIVKELVDRNYEYIDLNGDEKSAFFALKPEALPRLQSKVFLGDARELPEKDNSADISICLYVLRHNHAEDQWKIFRELIRVTKPGGYIFTEDFFFRRGRENEDLAVEFEDKDKHEDEGVTALYPKLDVAVSFYDKRKVLWYNSGMFNNENIWPVLGLEEIDEILADLVK